MGQSSHSSGQAGKIFAIAFFCDLAVAAVGLALVTSVLVWLTKTLHPGFWLNLALLMGGVILFTLYLLGFLRLMLWLRPIPPGRVAPGTAVFFVHACYVIIWGNFFYPLSRVLPMLVSRVFYQLAGARLGKNTFISGVLFDPFLITMGSNSMVGAYALVAPHINLGDRYVYLPIRIGDNVMIGGHVIIFGGCQVGDGAIVSAGAIVQPRTKIGPGEIWAGNPARLVGHRRANLS